MEDAAQITPTNFIDLATDIVSAYVSKNSLPMGEVPSLLNSIHSALTKLSSSAGTSEPETKLTPAQIKKSVTHDALISFEDGKPYKTLRRHLTIRGLSPEAYRAKWGLPVDYPMVAASYSEQRSSLAKSLGLGQQRRRPAPEPEPAPEPAKPAKAARKATAEARSEAKAAGASGRKGTRATAKESVPAAKADEVAQMAAKAPKRRDSRKEASAPPAKARNRREAREPALAE